MKQIKNTQLDKSDYEILGMELISTNQEIQDRYKHLTKLYHPDTQTDRPKEIIEAFEEKFQIINEAWNKIKEERKL